MRIYRHYLPKVTTFTALGQLIFFLCLIPDPVRAESVHLAWDPPAGGNIVGYLIYRATNSGGPYVRLSASPWPATYYADDSAEAGRIYHYAVTSVDANGKESAFSQEVSFSTASYDAAFAGSVLAVRTMADLTVDAGQLVVLSGSIWNPAAKNLTYLWTQTPPSTLLLTGVDTLEASFLAPIVVQDTVLTFTLSAKDGSGVIVYDTVGITVRPRR